MHLNTMSLTKFALQTFGKKLKEYNITGINVEFDGQGDQGDFSILSISCLEPESEKEIILDQPEELNDLLDEIGVFYVPLSRYGNIQTIVSRSFSDALTIILSEFLPPGCENNEGCLAQFDINQTRIKLNYAERYSVEIPGFVPDEDNEDDCWPDYETHLGESEISIIRFDGNQETEDEEDE